MESSIMKEKLNLISASEASYHHNLLQTLRTQSKFSTNRTYKVHKIHYVKC